MPGFDATKLPASATGLPTWSGGSAISMLYGSVSIVSAPEPETTESPGTTSIRSFAELPISVSCPEPPTSVSPLADGVPPDGVAAKLYMNSS